MKNKIVRRCSFILLCIFLNLFLYYNVKSIENINMSVTGTISSSSENDVQLFWGTTAHFTEEQSATFVKNQEGENIEFKLVIPSDTNFVRIDFGTEQASISIQDITFWINNATFPMDLSKQYIYLMNQTNLANASNYTLYFEAQPGDPFIVFDLSHMNLTDKCEQQVLQINQKYKIISCLFIDLLLVLIWICRKKVYSTIKIFIDNRALILDLSINDFKTRFVGAVFGTIWAFVQPIVTILVYWFVFQIGFKSGNSGNTQVPYALWLSTGLIPWFFFSESWNNATNSLYEYNYLVKKVVFNVSIIPFVKIISALFVHVFFVLLLLFMFMINGMSPNLFWIQTVYYSFAMFALVIALTYITSALVLFFKDISQIIAVLLQIGVWVTPIMWELDTSNMPSKLQWIFKLNPMYYIINGYRQALIYNKWAWNDVYLNIYFWLFTIILLITAQRIFKNLKPHFADVM